MTKLENRCPRCRRNCLDEDRAMNSIAHQDRKVQICSVCGQMEGLVKLGGNIPKSEVYPEQGTVFEKTCLENIADACRRLNVRQKAGIKPQAVLQ